MANSTQSIPSLLVFGPQTRPSPDDLEELREELVSNRLLWEIYFAALDLPEFWRKLVAFDPELAKVPAESHTHDLVEWLQTGFKDGRRTRDFALQCPITLTFLLNFLIQIKQYMLFLRSVDTEEAGDVQASMLKRLDRGGVHGFCVGFLCAITVSLSTSEEDVAENAARVLPLALAIGAYVDKDAANEPTTCISARWRYKQVNALDKALAVLKAYPEAYIAGITDETSMTITIPDAHLAGLVPGLEGHGFSVREIPVDGRFHSSVYTSAAERLVAFFAKTPDLRLPGPEQLQIPVRSSTDGKIICGDDLVRHALDNTLLKPVNWYQTVTLAMADVPQKQKCIALAGLSNHFPLSLVKSPDIQLQLLRDLGEKGTELDDNPSSIAGPEPTPGSPNGGNGTEGSWVFASDEELSGDESLTNDLPSDFPSHSVAVVGMAGRFPGANSVEELWSLLSSGKSSVQRAPDRIGLDCLSGDYSKKKWWGNFIDEPDTFDHKLFKKSPREAIACDPQQRKLLEVVYEALESSGYFGAQTCEPLASTDYGCYIGATQNNYVNNVSTQPPSAYATIGTGRSFISGAVGHYFGFTGPALTVDTACSSSLVAIHTACQAILAGDCSAAIAGGTNIITSPHDYRDLQAAGFLSPTGQCKPFDAGADGYCRSEAVAVVVLKSLTAAVQDHDRILGVVAGSAVNQNTNEAHITVPHAGSQTNLYRKVMSMAQVAPGDVTVVEAHGTGTTVGDPIEVSSLREAFGGASQRDSTLYFSSIKGNMGHAESAAGVAGLIKVLLMMKHGQIPPQASHQYLNPSIPALEPDRMAIPRQLTPWQSPRPVACVNSYGAAGSNSAVMVCGPPTPGFGASTQAPRVELPSKLPLIISAATKSSLSQYCQTLLDWLQQRRTPEPPDTQFTDVLFNLANRANQSLEHRLLASVSDMSDLKMKLSAAAQEDSPAFTSVPSPKPLVLVFGGQESQFVGLSKSVHAGSDIFRRHLDHCQKLLTQLGFEGIYPAIFQQTPIVDIVTLHTALFSVQYASAKAWMNCGLRVSAVVGHSFGQLTALCVSGALSLPDAIRLVTGRAALIKTHWGDEPGSMLSIQAERQKVEELVALLDRVKGQTHSYAEIACFNSPKSHVVVGSSKSIDWLESFIAEEGPRDGVRAKRLAVSHGFHSVFTETLLPHLEDIASELQWNSPSIHLELCEEGPISQRLDHRNITRHTRGPVYFRSAIERLETRYPECAWLEAGRGSSVTHLVRECLTTPERHSLFSPQLATLELPRRLPGSYPGARVTSTAFDSLADITVKLWKAGQKVQYWQFHPSQRLQYKDLSLPPYQFQKTRHWLPYVVPKMHNSMTGLDRPDGSKRHELLSLVKGDKLGEAVFRISPKSERFKVLVSSHIMADRAAVPASLYVEVAARAALALQEYLPATTWVPTVEDLVMKSPIGLDPESDISLAMQRLEGGDHAPSWRFEILHATSGSVKPQETTTGVVHLKKRTDVQRAHTFKRFETLIAPARWEHILRHPDAERMQGKHIYRAFSQIVQYSDAFKGIKTISCLGREAAGEVRISPDANNAPPDQRVADTPMIDSFMQFAGFLSNYFNAQSTPSNLFVCHQIEHLEFGPGFSADAGRWFVFASMTDSSEESTSVDIYVFEAQSSRLVLTALGMNFSRISGATLTRIIDGTRVDKPEATLESKANTRRVATEEPALKPSSTASRPKPAGVSTTKRPEIFQIIANIADVDLAEISGDRTLPDIGIDSLGVTEMISDISSILHVDLDLSTMLGLTDINALVAHIDKQLGLHQESSADDTPVSRDGTKAQANSSESAMGSLQRPHVKPNERPSRLDEVDMKSGSPTSPTIHSAYDAFNAVRLGYDELGTAANALNYWSDIYRDDARLMLAYITEAFAKLGCDLRTLTHGTAVPPLERVLPRHQKLVRQLHLFLADEGVVVSSPGPAGGFTRADAVIDETPADCVYEHIVTKHPQNATVRDLIRAVGSQLAECLVGEADGLQIVFGNKTNNKTLEDLYENWPMLVAATKLLGNFLLEAFAVKGDNAKPAGGGGQKPFRILEIGAGTGGTTRYIVDFLQRHSIPFEYHFTDLSGSLVQKAKRSFKTLVPDGAMTFGVLDIEHEPPAEFLEVFHVVISTNCIHATRDLARSLSNMRKMVRPDGAVALIEMTRTIYIFDIIVGLLEGWWLFEDGRSHALADEGRWTKAMLEAGFKEVLFSNGESAEAKTVRVIGGFPRSPPSSPQTEPAIPKRAAKMPGFAVEEVVYKTIGSQDIYADIYCPDNAVPAKKMPIALMIHGGSHILFSRKDIRPPQTRIMLEMGLLPVSLDHRLCPEVALAEGPMVDVCDALEWARTVLPHLQLKNPNIWPDPDRVVVVGWSSGGQLALSTGWTAPQRGLKPPDAILAFYCPTDYEDEWWRSPIQPVGAEDWGLEYDVLEAVQDEPITNYGVVGAWAPLSDPRIRTDPRCRIVLHINWKAQTLPVIIRGLVSRARADRGERAAVEGVDEWVDWNALPQPSVEEIRRCSPLAQVRAGNFATPTFMIHGTADDLIPYEQSVRTVEEMQRRGIDARLVVVPDAPHVCDMSSDPESAGWKAVLKAYEWLETYVR
ncbi:polyketide synthase [Apiospora sp. TS-2023a]